MNFEHLRNQWPELADLGAFAENYAVSDPQSSMVKLRCYIEKIVGYLYSELHLPVEPNASVHDKLTNHSFIQIVDRLILDKFHLIRRQDNKAAHEGYVDQHDAIWFQVTIVQPGMSKKKATEEMLKLLGTAELFIKKTTMAELQVWCSG